MEVVFFLNTRVGQICYRRSKLHDYCRILKVFVSYFVVRFCLAFC